MTNPRWIYWTRDFCCWLLAPPLGWGSTKQNTVFSRCQAIHHMTKLCGLQQTQRSTNPQKVACRFLSPLDEQLSVLLQNPQLILLAPIPPLTTLHFLTPQNTSFLFVKMVRYTFYFKLGNASYYLNKISRDSSVSIVTWLTIEWWGDRSLNSSRERSLSSVITSKPSSCSLTSYLMCTMRSHLGSKAFGAWT